MKIKSLSIYKIKNVIKIHPPHFQKEIACILSLIGINRAKQNTIKNRNKKRQISEDEEKTI